MKTDNSSILVTGSSGFIGKALISRLTDLGYSVIGLDLPLNDITSSESLKPYMDRPVSYVFHLAGKTFVPESWRDPVSFFKVNVLGTMNILEFCRSTQTGLTFVSSYLYGEPDYLPIDEDHPIKSYNPYSQSKLVADDTCRFYATHYNVMVSVLRPFNAYGPGQNLQFLIPEIINKVLDPAIEVIEVNDLLPRRDFVFVDDVVDALIRSITGPKGIYNIGSGSSKSVEDIITTVMDVTGIRKQYRSKGIRRPFEILDLYAGIEKANRELGWYPKIQFEEGIRRCLEGIIKTG